LDKLSWGGLAAPYYLDNIPSIVFILFE